MSRSIPVILIVCATVIAVVYLIKSDSNPIDLMPALNIVKLMKEEPLRMTCENETLLPLHSKVQTFLDAEKGTLKTETESDVIVYAAFMQMCARQRAISSCRRVAEKGNYCKNDNIEADRGFLSAVMKKKLFDGRRAASFGEGVGNYKKVLSNITTVYDGFDGNPFIEFFSAGTVKFFDLSIPTHFAMKYDVTICLEVIEHVPEQYENIVVRNLAESSNDLLIISWAKPGQGGLEHINEKPREYVIESFGKYGFAVEKDLSKYLRNSATFQWHSSNIIVFKKT